MASHGTITLSPISELYGRVVCDCDGERIGTVEEVFYTDRTRRIDWVAVQIGFLGSRRVVVPLHGAHRTTCGLVVAVDADVVRAAPTVDDVTVDEETERRLYEHYGISWRDGSGAASRAPCFGEPSPTPVVELSTWRARPAAPRYPSPAAARGMNSRSKGAPAGASEARTTVTRPRSSKMATRTSARS